MQVVYILCLSKRDTIGGSGEYSLRKSIAIHIKETVIVTMYRCESNLVTARYFGFFFFKEARNLDFCGKSPNFCTSTQC